jgi:hypothetical protein
MDRLQLLLDQSGLLNPPVFRDAWGQLSAYESVDIVSRTLEKRHGEIPAPDKATEVATQVVQGRQYFEAARHAETLIKPLLLYYGVLALSRAVILCSKIGLRETHLKPGHGVGSSGWNLEIARGSQVCSLSMELKKGTFDELALATSNVERLDLQDWDQKFLFSAANLSQLMNCWREYLTFMIFTRWLFVGLLPVTRRLFGFSLECNMTTMY